MGDKDATAESRVPAEALAKEGDHGKLENLSLPNLVTRLQKEIAARAAPATPPA